MNGSDQNNSGMSAIVAIVAIIAVALVGYFAVRYINQSDTDTTIDVNVPGLYNNTQP